LNEVVVPKPLAKLKVNPTDLQNLIPRSCRYFRAEKRCWRTVASPIWNRATHRRVWLSLKGYNSVARFGQRDVPKMSNPICRWPKQEFLQRSIGRMLGVYPATDFENPESN